MQSVNQGQMIDWHSGADKKWWLHLRHFDRQPRVHKFILGYNRGIIQT